MISVSVVLAFSLALFLTLLFPVMLLIFLAATKRIEAKAMWLGFASFFVSQILLRLPLLQLLSGQEWYLTFAKSYAPLLVVLLAFSAGLFEESARLAGAVLLKRKQPLTMKTVLSFGLGHAFCEVILLMGLTYLSNVVMSFVVLSGSSGLLPPGQLELIGARLAAVAPSDVLAAIVERVSAVLFHLFATTLVFLAVHRHKLATWRLAILAHTIFNAVVLLPLGLWSLELLLLGLGVLGGIYVLRSGPRFSPVALPYPVEQFVEDEPPRLE